MLAYCIELGRCMVGYVLARGKCKFWYGYIARNKQTHTNRHRDDNFYLVQQVACSTGRLISIGGEWLRWFRSLEPKTRNRLNINLTNKQLTTLLRNSLHDIWFPNSLSWLLDTMIHKFCWYPLWFICWSASKLMDSECFIGKLRISSSLWCYSCHLQILYNFQMFSDRGLTHCVG